MKNPGWKIGTKYRGTYEGEPCVAEVVAWDAEDPYLPLKATFEGISFYLSAEGAWRDISIHMDQPYAEPEAEPGPTPAWNPVSPWEYHPDHTWEDWVAEVQANDTRLGYVDWVNHRIEQEAVA